MFSDFAYRTLGVSRNKIKLLVNETANYVDIKKTIKRWLQNEIINGETEAYLFFTGHAFEGKWGLFMNTLKPKGRLHFLGLLSQPLNITMFHLLRGQNSVSASPVGGPEAMKKMVEFCARHSILPEVEFFKMSEINDAIAHLKSGKARYRIVLEN